MFYKRTRFLKFPLFVLVGCGLSLPLASCANETSKDDTPTVDTSTDQDNENDDTVDTNVPEETVDPNEDLTVPEQGEKTQIYLKRALTNLVIGQSLELKDYIGVLPGVNEDKEATSFEASILKVASEPTCASIAGTTLTLSKEGSFYLAIRANGESKVYSLTVGQSVLYSKLMDFLSGAKDNYTVEFFTTDENGKEEVGYSTYRGKNYFYSDTNNSGYVLSTKDNNIYTFSLGDNQEVEVNVPPAGDGYDYSNLFYNLSDFANPLYWSYTKSFSDSPEFAGYNYILNYTTTLSSRFCAALFLTTSLSYGGTTYYPYTIYARVTNDEIRFVPIYSNGYSTSFLYLQPCRIVDVGTTSIPSLDEYVENQEAPEKVDTTEVIDNFIYASNIMNYSWSTKMNVYYEDGSKLPTNAGVYTKYFKDFTNALNTRKIMKDGYWSDNFSGSNGTIIPGGLVCVNNKTYLYRNYSNTTNVDDYTLEGEYIQYGSTTSFPNWYSYDNMIGYLLSGAFSFNNLFNGYPTKDGDDYIFNGSNATGLEIVTSALAFSCQPFSANSGMLHQALQASKSSSFRVHFEYDGDHNLTGMTFTTRLVLDHTLEDDIDQDYTMEYITEVTDIGTTDFSPILNHIKDLIKEAY